MNLEETYNQIAEDYHKDHANDDNWIKGTDKLVELIGLDSTVLDAGCGTGLKSEYLISKGLKVTGVDLSENMIKIARRENPTGKFIVMDMRDLDRLDEKFDGVFAQASLLHIPKKEIQETIGKLVNRLKEGGYLYIALKEKSDKDEEVVKENDYGYEYERFFSYYTMEELKRYLDKLKFKIIWQNKTTLPRYNWIQIIAKESK